MKHHLISGAILLAALMLYTLGFSGIGFIAFMAGGILELLFWVRLFAK